MPLRQNTMGGNALGVWFGRDRILDGDEFTVHIVNT
jgi:hypothetical protein